MSLTTKSLLYNFICFAVLYTVVYLLADSFTHLTGYLKPITAAVCASLLSPKFQAADTRDGKKLFMKWLFLKGIREVK